MASIKDKAGGAFSAITAIKKRSGGASSNAVAGKVKVSGAWVTFWSNEHTVSVPPQTNANLSNGSHTTGITATVSGGIGPFTYSWTKTGGGTLSNATSSTCIINTSGNNTLYEGTVTCNVTDTGNGNLVRSDSGDYAIQHGTPI